MTKYEVMYILSSGLNDAEKEALIEKLSALVKSNGGEVESVNKWGNRRLAYPINFKNEGYYVLMTYSANSDFNVEFERNMRIHSGEIMRFMITKKIINSKTPAPKAKPAPAYKSAPEGNRTVSVKEATAEAATKEVVVSPAIEKIVEDPAVKEVAEEVVVSSAIEKIVEDPAVKEIAEEVSVSSAIKESSEVPATEEETSNN